MNKVNNIFNRAENKEKWEELCFVLEKRDKPTIIVIGFNSYLVQKKTYKKFKFFLKKYKFYDLNLSGENLVSLNQVFLKKLPESVLKSNQAEYIVNIFGMEKKIKESAFIRQMNFERDVLFQNFPFIIIIWTDEYTIDKLKKEAKDFWDWVSYCFEFKIEDENDILKSSNQVFISYVREDYQLVKTICNDIKKAGFKIWLDEDELLVGQNWKIAIDKAIRNSLFFLLFLSSNSVKKNYFQRELTIAFDVIDTLPLNQIFIIPVYLEPREIFNAKLRDIQGINLYDSYEKGLKQILHVFYSYKNDFKQSTRQAVDTSIKLEAENLNRIGELQQRYDKIKSNNSLQHRIIKEKINIQKSLGKKFMEINYYKRAEQSFRTALSLAEQVKGLEYEKEEILFLLNQVYYQPII
jgi:hypothetical protein